MLHIRCGNDILGKLRDAGVPGEFIKWADPLCQGPTRLVSIDDQWQGMRARFLSENYGISFEEALDDLSIQDSNLEKYTEHDEVILWFEHDLFDQVILIYLLDWFSKREMGKTKLSLICISNFPGVETFIGLGNLSPTQLASLYGTQHEVTLAEKDLASRAWNAYCSSEPLAIKDLLAGDTSALPFLGAALRRHLQQYPSLRNGLNLTEQRVLEVVASEETQPKQIFQLVQAREESPWLGDTMFWPYLKSLSAGDEPLLAIKGFDSWPNIHEVLESPLTLHITQRGREVLAGEADWIRLNGIDRWLGGVHLQGKNVLWRWDEENGRLIRSTQEQVKDQE